MKTSLNFLHQRSRVRSIVFTVSMIILFFLIYVVIDKVYYASINVDDFYFMPSKYFFIFYCIAALPIFGFFFFKYNIWTNFWEMVEKPHIVDYLFFGVIILFLFISFNHGDIQNTATQGFTLLEMVIHGQNILEFYNYTKGMAAYLLPQYIVFGVWSVPVLTIYKILGILSISVNDFSRITGLTLWWYKLLPTLFYLGSAFTLFKIGILLKFAKNKAKWLSLIWILCPMAMFSQFIFGQYDSVGMFFELLMVYFFLQKKPMKASLICMVAMTFKMFPFFIFLPLLLLVEKKPLKVIGYTTISAFGYFFFTELYSGSSAFQNTGTFNNGILDRFFVVGIAERWGLVSFFIAGVIGACIFAYFSKPKDLFTYYRYVLFIPLLVYCTFFCFVLFNPQWILLITPYLVLNMFLNKNTKGLIILAIGIGVGYLLSVMCGWNQNVDANMVNLGIFPQIFGFTNSGATFKSLNTIASLNKTIPSSPYFTLFVCSMAAILILSAPTRKNILASKRVLSNSFAVKRGVVWIYGMTVLLFAMPAIFLFFAHTTMLYSTNTVDKTFSPVGEITKSIDVMQEFHLNATDVSNISIDIDFATYARTNTSHVTVTFGEIDGVTNVQSALYTTTLDASKLSDNSMYNIGINKSFNLPTGQYYFTVTSDDAVTGNAVTVWTVPNTNLPSGTVLYLNGQKTNSEINFQVVGQ